MPYVPGQVVTVAIGLVLVLWWFDRRQERAPSTDAATLKLLRELANTAQEVLGVLKELLEVMRERNNKPKGNGG